MELTLENKIELEELIRTNHISKIKHPFYDLFLLSYTKKTSAEAKWVDTTLNARGLIIDSNFNIISRPFKKFFEIFQLSKEVVIPYNLNTTIYEKLDGSLVISYWVNDSFFLTTKGKFDSFQSIIANKIFKNKYTEILPFLNKKYTYIFELISPFTTNIIDYGNIEDLYLLEIIDTFTNESIEIESVIIFKKPKKYNILLSDAINDNDKSPEEGYVVKFENDFRLKIKKRRFKLSYHKNQALKREILNSIYNSKQIENFYKNKSENELLMFKKLYKKAVDLIEFIDFYLNSDTLKTEKLEIIEYFKLKYENNNKLNFFILERLFTTSQYFSLKVPYNNSFLRIAHKSLHF